MFASPTENGGYRAQTTIPVADLGVDDSNMLIFAKQRNKGSGRLVGVRMLSVSLAGVLA